MKVRRREVKEILPLIRALFPNAHISIEAGDKAMVVEEGGEVVAFIHICEGKERVVVKGIGVIPALRNRGIGGMLMERVIKKAEREGKQVFLKVKESNPAINFYLKHGFMFFKQHAGYYTLVYKPKN